MKKLLLALVMFLLAVASCQKEKSPVASVGNTTTKKDTTTSSPVTTPPVTPSQVTISGISPDTGTIGTVVTITGTNFTNSTVVSFNGVTGIIQSTTATEIKVIAPLSTSGRVLVTTNNQTVIGPAFTYTVPVITAISPTSGASGTIVTVTGTNFGTSPSVVHLLFNGVVGTTQSITPTEIKVTVPVTTSGNITLVFGSQNVTGPVFTYTSIFTAPYTNGDVVLRTQAEVDGFVNQNKGRQLQITGRIYISGADISSVSGLSNITSVSGDISLSACPLLTDVSFLNGITSAGGISFQNLVISAITMDKLAGATASVIINSCKNLHSLSFKALTDVISNNVLLGTGIRIISCEQLLSINFSSLVSVVNVLYLSGTAITDLSGFSSLQTAGSLNIASNPSLINFHGLEHLTVLTLPGSTRVISGSTINGLYITSNPKLNSLAGLQSLTTAPITRITGNAALSDFCPLKPLILKLITSANISYISGTDNYGNNRTASMPALTLTNNGNYITTADALAAVKLCN